MRIGLISDTHGLLRPEAVRFLHGCDAIMHAGDIGDASILTSLARIAPLTAVRGNNDHGAWADGLPLLEALQLGGCLFVLVHDRADLPADDVSMPAMVIHGHSHRPAIVSAGARVFVNPGSAGPRRFTLPVSIGELIVEDGRAEARLHTLL